MLSKHVKVVFRLWVVVFALVGAQMGWVLRPFVGNPNLPFTWFCAASRISSRLSCTRSRVSSLESGAGSRAMNSLTGWLSIAGDVLRRDGILAGPGRTCRPGECSSGPSSRSGCSTAA